MENAQLINKVCSRLLEQSLPKWEDLPDLELYMDQVLILVGRYLGNCPGQDAKGLTSSMVNNYVKAGLLPPPVHKRYTREHVAKLLIICILKSSLPISMLQSLISSRDAEPFYEMFRSMFEKTAEQTVRDHTGASEPSVLIGAALRARAEQALAQELYETFGTCC